MIRWFLETLLEWAGDAWIASLPGSSIDIVDQGERTLVLRSGSRQTSLDKRLRTVSRDGRVVTRFDRIEAVEVKHRRGRDNEPDCWSVRLRLPGWFSSVPIGRTRDDAEASIAAARLAAFTGKPVRSV